MSYDIWLEADLGGARRIPILEDRPGNYTSNVSGIWKDALGHSLADFHGRRAGEVEDELRTAIDKLSDPARYDAYRAMEPSNGWGSLEGARKYLQDLLAVCREAPDAYIHVSH